MLKYATYAMCPWSLIVYTKQEKRGRNLMLDGHTT